MQSNHNDLGLSHSIVIDGVSVPTFIYGTAWKEEQTQALTELAIRAGFRGIDTANQRKHYFEQAVGAGLQTALQTLQREELFVQTKFTYERGQDHRLPYDPKSSLTTQVTQSFASSMEHLGITYIDSYVLHGPEYRAGLSKGDKEVWRAMESLYEKKLTKLLGVSNVSLEQLTALYEFAKVKPRFVQNRCYADQGWDRKVRAFCSGHGITYQGFSLLTANRQVLSSDYVQRIAKAQNCTVPAIVFRLAMHIGILPLTGTSSEQHMATDLACYRVKLSSEQITYLEQMAG